MVERNSLTKAAAHVQEALDILRAIETKTNSESNEAAWLAITEAITDLEQADYAIYQAEKSQSVTKGE